VCRDIAGVSGLATSRSITKGRIGRTTPYPTVMVNIAAIRAATTDHRGDAEAADLLITQQPRRPGLSAALESDHRV
jgi:hypothetical protein